MSITHLALRRGFLDRKKPLKHGVATAGALTVSEISSNEERQLWERLCLIASAVHHPDAAASCLRLSLATSPYCMSATGHYTITRWDTSQLLLEYVRKRHLASANCRLTPEEELQLLTGGNEGAMAQAGGWHTVLLRSDGQAIAYGCNRGDECSIPPLDEGISYTQVAAGGSHTALLRSDGQAVACGENADGQCTIPPLDGGLSYIQVSAGEFHTVLLRSDGEAVACGFNQRGQCNIPSKEARISYIQVSAGGLHTVFLRSDGKAVGCGFYNDGQCSFPPLAEGLSYTQVSAGASHTVLLRSDGQAVACGSNSHGQCNIPPKEAGISYIQVSAGNFHTLFLRSDGQVVACGSKSDGQCSIPPLPRRLSYSQVSAGALHTVLLRSDGEAVAFGWNSSLQCNIPPLRSWREWLPFGFAAPSYRYICDFTTFPLLGTDRVVQVDFLLEGNAGVTLKCVGLDGLEVLRLKAQKSDRTVDVCSRVARELDTNVENLRMVLPDARLLGTISKANPFATLSDVILAWQKPELLMRKQMLQAVLSALSPQQKLELPLRLGHVVEDDNFDRVCDKTFTEEVGFFERISSTLRDVTYNRPEKTDLKGLEAMIFIDGLFSIFGPSASAAFPFLYELFTETMYVKVVSLDDPATVASTLLRVCGGAGGKSAGLSVLRMLELNPQVCSEMPRPIAQG
eukprot:symbB.v1.2.021769.t1/scaffold1821.1/size219240/8